MNARTDSSTTVSPVRVTAFITARHIGYSSASRCAAALTTASCSTSGGQVTSTATVSSAYAATAAAAVHSQRRRASVCTSMVMSYPPR